MKRITAVGARLRLAFADADREQRYQTARDAWLREWVLPVALLVAAIFLAFIAFDLIAAPDQVADLAVARVGTAAFLVGVGALARYRPDVLSISLTTGLLVSGIYAGVLVTQVIVGGNPQYEFTEAVMLIQVGTWFFGGVTFAAAALMNSIAIVAYLAIDHFAIGKSGGHIGQSALYLWSLYFISLIASWNIERQFRANFAANEELAEQKRDYRARAMRDALTGLWNRAAMLERIAATTARETPGAVLMIDLDGFKPVNDRHGHQAGDEALVAVARRILSVLRPGDSVGRVGGDEFVVLAEDVTDSECVRQLGERIRTRVGAPMRVRVHGDSMTVEVQVGASVGVTTFHGAMLAPEEIIRRADVAMYEDKARRKAS